MELCQFSTRQILSLSLTFFSLSLMHCFLLSFIIILSTILLNTFHLYFPSFHIISLFVSVLYNFFSTVPLKSLFLQSIFLYFGLTLSFHLSFCLPCHLPNGFSDGLLITRSRYHLITPLYSIEGHVIWSPLQIATVDTLYLFCGVLISRIFPSVSSNDKSSLLSHLLQNNILTLLFNGFNNISCHYKY